MAIDARIRELSARHKLLEETIRVEMLRPASDTLKLKELKRRKLKLKEEMERMRGVMLEPAQ